MVFREIMDLLLEAKRQYSSDLSNSPIRKTDCLEVLDLFERLVSTVNYPSSYDTDFRRNLPGGGLRGLNETSSIQDRIDDARSFLNKNSAYANTGEAILDNLIGCIHLADKQKLLPSHLDASLVSTLQSVASGNLR
jgi:hypothetical protein